MVAVLVLNWNGQRDTIECLESLFRLDYPKDRLSVVLCDNASTDGSVEAFRQWALAGQPSFPDMPAALQPLAHPPVPKPIQVVEYSRQEAERGGDRSAWAPLVMIHTGANLGFAGGNNVGLAFLAQRTDYDLIWILNNDIVVAPDSLKLMVEHLASNPAAGAVGGTLMEYREPDEVQIAGGGMLGSLRGPHAVQVVDRPLDYISGGCMLVRIDVIRRVGPISEEYFLYGEDVDYSMRIRTAGYRLSYERAARVWHKGGAAVGHFSPRHDYYVLRNNLYLIRKYRPASMPVAAAYMLYRFVLPKIVRRQWTRLAHLRKALVDFSTGTMGRLVASDLE